VPYFKRLQTSVLYSVVVPLLWVGVTYFYRGYSRVCGRRSFVLLRLGGLLVGSALEQFVGMVAGVAGVY